MRPRTLPSNECQSYWAPHSSPTTLVHRYPLRQPRAPTHITSIWATLHPTNNHKTRKIRRVGADTLWPDDRFEGRVRAAEKAASNRDLGDSFSLGEFDWRGRKRRGRRRLCEARRRPWRSKASAINKGSGRKGMLSRTDMMIHSSEGRNKRGFLRWFRRLLYLVLFFPTLFLFPVCGKGEVATWTRLIADRICLVGKQ